MPSHRHYPRAPITEALIDLRVAYRPGISLEKLKGFGSEIREQYPNESARDMVQGQISMTEAAPVVQSSRSTVGYIFHSIDRLQAVQVRLDGFTISRFAPYENWDHLVEETRRIWSIFVRSLQPDKVLRVATRYVNQINLPLKEGTLKFEDYLRTFPACGLTEDIALEQFFLRLVMPQTDLSATLILTEALLPPQAPLPPKSETLGVILDIDVFRQNLDLDVHSDEIWAMLELFRSRKNKFFEGSITDATRELFL